MNAAIGPRLVSVAGTVTAIATVPKVRVAAAVERSKERMDLLATRCEKRDPRALPIYSPSSDRLMV